MTKLIKYAALGSLATCGIGAAWLLLSAMLYFAPIPTACMLVSFAAVASPALPAATGAASLPQSVATATTLTSSIERETR